MKGCVLLFVFAALMASADAFDEAAGPWAKKISSHLAADEVAHITWREAAPMDAGAAAYVTRAKALLARTLQRRVKDSKPVEISAAVSQNLKDYLFIVEMHREDENIVEIARVPRIAAPPAPAAGFQLERKMLWEQEEPILDAIEGIGVNRDRMLVLDTAGVTLFERRDAKWQKIDAAVVNIPPVRDPRGRLTITENTLLAEVAGLACRGSWSPALTLECQPGGRFTAGRNTMEASGWPAFFAQAEIDGDHIVVAADGRTYLYDASRKQTAAPDAWDDFALLASSCAGPKIVALESEARTVALFELANHIPVRVSESMLMPGDVTAVWPDGNDALVVVRNKNNGYEAYHVGVDCGR